MAPSIPLAYSIFFLWIEPIATLAGAFAAAILPATYLALTDPASAPAAATQLAVGTHVSLLQLGNMYLAFALVEALVLRASIAAAAAADLAVWRTLLSIFLVADLGHLLSLFPLGLDMYYDVRKWNAIAYGNYLFVYVGATFRILFLLRVGFQSSSSSSKRGAGRPRTGTAARKSIKPAAAPGDELLATPTPTAAQLSRTPAQSTRRRKSKAASAS